MKLRNFITIERERKKETAQFFVAEFFLISFARSSFFYISYNYMDVENASLLFIYEDK